MHPILFTLGEFEFYTYGLMIGIGFVAGVWVASKRAEQKGIDPDSLFWLFIALLAGGVLGGRIFHVALNSWAYLDWASFLDTREGGLSIHGVLIGGALSLALYAKAKKLSFLELGDVLAPSVALGQGIGRIGCLFSGCCYGIVTSGSWGVRTRFAPGLRHPFQLYESIADLILFILLLQLAKRIDVKGGLFLTYVTGYSCIRFFLEFVRANDSHLAGLSYAQWASAVAAVVSIMLYQVLKNRSKQRDEIII
jgi:phosphatidylglycerol:prolipoprotein diacylglycerol transferase